jgi:hypothetical protein
MRNYAKSLGKKKKVWNADEVITGNLKFSWNFLMFVGLYIGDQIAAMTKEQMKKHNITHILCVIGGEPLYPKVFPSNSFILIFFSGFQVLDY